MKKVLKLGDARVSAIDLLGEDVVVSFSHALVRPSDIRNASTSWSQEAELLIQKAVVEGDADRLPGTVQEGFMESGGALRDYLPLPFQRKGPAVLTLQLENGGAVTIRGEAPLLELVGEPIPLEDID